MAKFLRRFVATMFSKTMATTKLKQNSTYILTFLQMIQKNMRKIDEFQLKLNSFKGIEEFLVLGIKIEFK